MSVPAGFGDVAIRTNRSPRDDFFLWLSQVKLVAPILGESFCRHDDGERPDKEAACQFSSTAAFRQKAALALLDAAGEEDSAANRMKAYRLIDDYLDDAASSAETADPGEVGRELYRKLARMADAAGDILGRLDWDNMEALSMEDSIHFNIVRLLAAADRQSMQSRGAPLRRDEADALVGAVAQALEHLQKAPFWTRMEHHSDLNRKALAGIANALAEGAVRTALREGLGIGRARHAIPAAAKVVAGLSPEPVCDAGERPGGESRRRQAASAAAAAPP